MPQPPIPVCLQIDGTPAAVRGGLRQLFGIPVIARLSEPDRGTLEIVLAEVFNNIVEHAYANHSGQIQLAIQIGELVLKVAVSDTGAPMPGLELPKGLLVLPSRFEDLPEGGFGWHLIRTLSRDLAYQREGNRNWLSFDLIREQC